MRISRPRFRPFYAIVAMVAMAALCSCRSTVESRLTEEQANQILVVLNENGIAANKVRESVEGQQGRYRVEVASGQASRALSLLQAAKLPKRSDPGWERFFGTAGLVPTANEENARFAAALGGELARSIETMDGVLDARVHLVLPVAANAVLDASPAQPRASVMIKYRYDARPIDEKTIRTLVAGAAPNMEPGKVAVVTIKASPPRSAAPKLVQIGPVVVTSDTALMLKAILGTALLLLTLMSLAVIALLTRVRRASTRQ